MLYNVTKKIANRGKYISLKLEQIVKHDLKSEKNSIIIITIIQKSEQDRLVYPYTSSVPLLVFSSVLPSFAKHFFLGTRLYWLPGHDRRSFK